MIKSFRNRFKKIGRRSLLASTSSIAGTNPIPFAATYSASKRFVDFMTWALAEELSTHGVDVCCWKAATVSTKMTKYARGLIAVSPQSYASQALSKCTSGVNSGAFSHELIYAFLQCISDVVPMSLIIKVFGKRAKKGADRVKAREESSKASSS